MRKTKWHILGGALFCLLTVGLAGHLINPAKAETTSTTFPVNEAGIAAYVKLDSVDITDLTEALNYFASIEKQGKTYVIGTKGLIIDNKTLFRQYPHVYIGLDGWIVAYYLDIEDAGRIMKWGGYTAGTINTTTLKDTIDNMAANIGVTYSTPIKYYDFEFPEANKLTVIAEYIRDYYGRLRTNSFSVTIPGTLYEASYSVLNSSGYLTDCSLSVDGFKIDFIKEDIHTHYETGRYDPLNLFEPNLPHYVTLGSKDGNCFGATALIYKN